MTRARRVFLSAGEVSGDMYGAALARALRAVSPEVTLEGLGGPRMAAAGVELQADVTGFAAVGLLEQLPALGPVNRAFGAAARRLAASRPDVLVLIDFQGANLRLAAQARRLGIPTVYYILPQAWLWGLPGDVRRVAGAVDRLIAVFGPEAAAYSAGGGRVSRVGHPLLDLLPPPVPEAEPPCVALLPGSRRQEVARLLPAFLGAAARLAASHPGLRFVLPAASGTLAEALRAPVTQSGLPITLVEPGAWGEATVALVASGTAVLEAAVRGVPCVAAYRVSALTAWLARRLLHGPYVTLPNILLGRRLVPECLQGEASPERLAAEVEALLTSPAQRAAQRAGYEAVRAELGGPGGITVAAGLILGDAGLWGDLSLPPSGGSR